MIKNSSRTMMKYHHVCLCVLALIIIGLLVFSGFSGYTQTTAAGGQAISGNVLDEHGPVAGANVRIQGTKKAVLTDQAGNFLLSGLSAGEKVNISVWKEGYYCALQKSIAPPAKAIRFELIRYFRTDNKAYAWLAPEGGKNTCRECHPAIVDMSLNDPHLKAAANPRFLTMYYGTDMQGNQSPQTRYAKGRGPWKHLVVPSPPDSAKPYYGPGYQLDFPGTAGNCTACHIPGAALSDIDHPRSPSTDPKSVKQADKYGIHCDFCHKIADVKIAPLTGLPFLRFPGVHSLDIRRPFTEDRERPQLFFGTFDDVNASEGDTHLPLFKESRYCGACHYGVFWSTIAYNSYGEWLRSPYADPRSGKARTCQECHMPSPTLYKGKPITNIAPGKGGIERNPSSIHSHDMTVNEELLRNSLSMSSSARQHKGRVLVEVNIVNDKTGHHVPSDSPLRHLILLVEAKDEKGNLLRQKGGPVLPNWCGNRKNINGHYAGLPGKAYAKLLKEKWTDIFPTAAYWNHTELVSDNRIAAFAEDSTTFEFVLPENGKGVFTVSLLYRRAFIELMEQKKWNAPDILMAQKKIIVIRK